MLRLLSRGTLSVVLLLSAGCVGEPSARAPAPPPLAPALGPSAPARSPFPELKGRASWYGQRFEGKKTASGERFDPAAITAAHPKLPFGTLVKVTDLATGKHVVVRINDRGPHDGKRVLDLSQGAARELGIEDDGVAEVSFQVVGLVADEG